MAVWKDLMRASGDSFDAEHLANYVDAVAQVELPAPGTPLVKRDELGLTEMIRVENRPTQRFQVQMCKAFWDEGVNRLYAEAPPLRTLDLATSKRDCADLVTQEGSELQVFEFKSKEEIGERVNDQTLDEALFQLLFYAVTWHRRANDWHAHFEGDGQQCPSSVKAILVTEADEIVANWRRSTTERLRSPEVAERLSKWNVTVWHGEWTTNGLGEQYPLSVPV